MDKIILGTAIAFFITFTAIPIIIQVANMKKLFDVPDERKIHILPVPSLGGLGMFAGFILALLLAIPFSEAPEFQYFAAAALVIFFLGLKDDILVLTPLKKFIGQLAAAFLIIQKGNILLYSMHGFMGVYVLPEMLGLAFSYLTVVVIVNSFNLIDGVDGLAASLGLFTSLSFGTFFYLIGDIEYAVLSYCMSGSIVAFLIFNYAPARIFMGDTGSLLIGLVNAILVIRFINSAAAPSGVFPIGTSPAVGFAILIVPLFDTLRVFAIRMLRRRSPFSPDRNHIHHLLMDHGCSHARITYLCLGLNVTIAFIVFLLKDSWNTTVLILTQILVMLLITGYLWGNRKKKPVLYKIDSNVTVIDDAVSGMGES